MPATSTAKVWDTSVKEWKTISKKNLRDLLIELIKMKSSVRRHLRSFEQSPHWYLSLHAHLLEKRGIKWERSGLYTELEKLAEGVLEGEVAWKAYEAAVREWYFGERGLL